MKTVSYEIRKKGFSILMRNTLRGQTLIEKFARIKEKYGDNYPIILYEPAIKCQENQTLKVLIQRNSSIHLFTEFEKASRFVKDLGVSFILITSKDCDEQHVLENFGALENTFGRRILDIEEEVLLNSVFKGISNEMIKPLGLKVYIFCTVFDWVTEVHAKEGEEEVILMCDLKEIVKEFREDFLIIWYDPSITPERKAKLEEGIEMEIQEKYIYKDFQALLGRIKDETGTPYHLIVSGATISEVQELAKGIENLKDLLGLYMICDDTMDIEKNDKIVVHKTLEELIPKIKEGIRIRSKLRNTFPAFATDFDASDRSGIYKLHYFLKGLINFHNRKQAKEDFMKLARKIYQDQEKELTRFEERYNKYNKAEILRWYTKDSSIYRLINNCLRISSSDSILYCRLILKDLERALREQYQEKSKDFSGVVYRGAFISKDEWKKLESNRGKEIEMYGFLSTSKKKKVALDFLKADLENKIFIKIIVPSLPELDEQGFADISEYSHLKKEEEILFNVRSRFRILETEVIEIDGMKCRQLVLLYGAQLLRKYMTKTKPSIEIKLELSSEIECNLCGSKEKLFGFKQQEETAVNCLECLIKVPVAQNIPFIALDEEKDKLISKFLPGKIFTYKKTVSFSNCGYKCHDCKGTAKEKYYKWMSCDGVDVSIQCSECFEKKKTLENKILISEGSPYGMWQEQQKESETIDSHYQGFLSQTIGSEDQAYIYLEIQDYRLCIAYGRKVIEKLKNKRRREKVKFNIFYILGMAYEHLGKYQEALKCLEKCKGMVKFINRENFLTAANLYCILANIHKTLSQYQKAEEYYKQALDFQQYLCEEKQGTIALSLIGLGKIYQNLDENEKALEHFTQALTIQKSLFGDKHPDTAHGYESLGLFYRNLGKNPDALNYFQMSLTIRESIYGERHGLTVTSYINVAAVYFYLKNYQKAKEFLDKTLKIQISISEEIHPKVAVLYNNFAAVLRTLGQYQEALDYFKKAFKMFKSLYGEKHPEIALCLNNLGTVYQSCGNYKKALKYFLRALDLGKSFFGENDTNIAALYCNIGTICKNLKEHDKALKYSQKALDIQRLVFGDHHPHIVVSYSNLAGVFEDLGQYEKALELNVKAVDGCKVVYGEQHSRTADSYHKIGSMYFNLGNNEKAIEFYEKTINIQRSELGEKHPNLVTSYSNVAKVFQKLERYQEAFEHFDKALCIQISSFGEENTLVVYLMYDLASVSEHLKRYQLAREYLSKSMAIKISLKKKALIKKE